ncbi:MAG: radical SAM protein, partial [Fusicatenibacter sp.]|nr:radical SAM protein [Fusicatenibacter sp.]
DVPVHIDPYMMPGTRERNRPYNQQIRVLPEEAAQASLKALKIQLPEEFYRQYIIQSIEKVENSDATKDDGHISCLAGNCSFTINWQGEMRPCVMMTGPSVPVFETGFKRAWEEICSQTQKICISSLCTQCSLRPLCKICAAGALLETGTYDGVPDYLCRYSKELYRLIQQEGKMYG